MDARDAIVSEHGPWIGYNLELAEGDHTIGPGLVGAADVNVARVVQLVADHAGAPLAGLRVLDLGCHEGGFSIELARHGATVVGIEARPGHIAKARYAKDVLGLENLEFVQDDIRNIDVAGYGTFDVVLCLGVLYHLPAGDVVGQVRRVAELSRRTALIETQVSLSGRDAIETADARYWGHRSSENPRNPGAALDDTSSFWLTLPSLLNALTDAGFTSVAECLSPPVLPLARLADHVTLLATRGERVALRSLPAVNQLPRQAWRWREGGRTIFHFSQRSGGRLRDTIARRRARDFDAFFADAMAKGPADGYVGRWGTS